MDHEIHTILERLRLIEGDITPVNVKSGLNKQQQSVKQMPALFKPKTQKILGGNADAKNPMSGYMVGSSESREMSEDAIKLEPGDRVAVSGQNEHQGEFAEVVELSPSGKFVVISLEKSGEEVSMHLSDVELTADESQLDDDDPEDWDDSDDSEFVESGIFEDKHLDEEATEDMLTKVKSSFTDYLKSLEDNIRQDRDLLAKKREDFDMKKRKMKDLELQIKQRKAEKAEEVEEGTDIHSECMMPVVKTVTFEDGSACTIHGDESNGFIIRRGERQLPSKFDQLDHATMALDMYRAKRAAGRSDDSADYIEEK